MIDIHNYPAIDLEWGVKPVLFQIGGLAIPSYAFFVALGLAVGIFVYYLEAKKHKQADENSFFIVLGAIFGGTLGAKLLFWILNYQFIIDHLQNLTILFSGRTIIGGLIGGMIGAKVTKRILKIKTKRGNLFAPGIALGVAIGRLGCFLRGCCFGEETGLIWGVDFGDHIARHPTQIYESLFMFGMFLYLYRIKNRPNILPGELFKILMIWYFMFRFLIEFIRVEKIAWIGLTFFQWIALLVIVYFLRDIIINIFNVKKYDSN